jgi:ATP-dependent 26S proteasome regulatory subunit
MQGVPLLYVPLEVVMSKYYGESERLLASIFSAGNELPEGAIVFLDEVSALTTFSSRLSNVVILSPPSNV